MVQYIQMIYNLWNARTVFIEKGPRFKVLGDNSKLM